MAAEDGGGRRTHTTVAVIVVLCSLAQSLTCFSLQGSSDEKKQDKLSEATVMEVRDGSILFNGKKLDSLSGSASAVTGTEKMPAIDLDHSGNTGVLEQTSELEKATVNEAAWRRMKPSLHCGRNNMTFKARGPGATYLQLDMGNAHLLPLNQVPETCSYSMKQNLLGLVLVVPYEGCNVTKEDGNYVLSMSWLQTPVKLTCPVLKNYTATSSTANPAQQPWKFPFPHGPWNLNRHKRHANQPFSIYDIRHYYPYLNNYNYYMNMMTPAPASAAATTTAKPDMTTTSTTTTESSPSPMMPPANQNLYLYYLYLYSLYYPYYYYPPPNVPMMTTQPPTTTTTATPTSGPATSGMTATPKMTTTSSGSTTTAPGSTTTAPGSTTTASPVTTKAPQIPLFPYYPPYFPFPYYPPAGQQFPDNADTNYYQIIQHYYGKPPYPQIPPPSMQATQAPTTTTKPGESTTTVKTDASTPTAKPSDASTTMKPTTVSPPTTTCGKTVCPTKPSGDYPGPFSPYVPYYQLPFIPYVKYNKAGKLAYDQKYMPQVDYKSGPQARAHPPPHPGFHYWQPVPWFPQSSGQENLKFAWKQSTV